MKEVVFDIEVYPEWWCIVHTDPDDINKKSVITSETENYKNIIYQLSLAKVLIGFNIKDYDMRILNGIQHCLDPSQVYDLSLAIINNQQTIFNDFTYWNRFNFSDLYDDWKFGSLKEFESNIGMNIQETEIPFDKKNLTKEEKELILKYCMHDVDATVKLLEFRREVIDSKKIIGEMFGISEDKALKCTYAKISAIVLKAQKETRPLETKFTIPNRVKSYIQENLPQNVIDLFESINDDPKEIKLFDNVIQYGIGGIHSTYGENIVCKTDNYYKLINIDVTSYYPNLIMIYDYMSRNVPDPSIFRYIYDLRVKLKKDAEIELNANGKTEKYKELNGKQKALKIILNATYGAMKNEYSNLYDPFQGSNICYLGQLLLSALANKIYKLGAKIIQTNTDGILIKVENEKESAVMELVKEWENITGLNMENDYVTLFFQRDVNNYIEVTDNTKNPYKLKGKWSNQADISLEKRGEAVPNLNAPITHKALLEFYLHDTPIEKTINDCNSLFEFCFTAKRGRTYEKTYHFINGEPVIVNKVNRVIATTNPIYGTIKKFKIENDKPRYDKIGEIPNQCYIVNNELEMVDHLDKNWYIEFAKNKLKELKWV